jgi:hypothetical protein
MYPGQPGADIKEESCVIAAAAVAECTTALALAAAADTAYYCWRGVVVQFVALVDVTVVDIAPVVAVDLKSADRATAAALVAVAADCLDTT